ncbi:MAG: thioesterase family protein [Alphaproteobacteria bacterium]|nr:thioesterase family protein [Alphaproteobacteria bacterium]
MAFNLHSEHLQDSWLDAYGHLNEGYYLVVFSNATWALQDYLGVGPAYTRLSGKALYTAESHLRYLREVRAPAMLEVVSSLFDFDPKKIHLGHVLIVDGQECATVECALVHVSTETGRSCLFTDDQMERFAQAAEEKPSWSGARVTIRRS